MMIKQNKLKLIFFSILFAFFFNILFILSSCAYNKKVEIKPLILNDYDDGILRTNTGGISGGDEELPGTTFTAFTPDDNFTKGNSGYSLMLDYDVSGIGEFSFYWIKLGKDIDGRTDATETLDLTDYNYMSFWIKGAQGGEKLKIELHEDSDTNGSFVFGRDITSYVYADAYLPEGNVTQDWQRVFIPLKDFKGISDFSKMLELVFVFENRTGNTKGIIYVDDIIFGNKPKDIIESDTAPTLNPPIEDSFRVNGVNARQCLTFTQSNELQIKAECIKENPFVESVSFEYSTDDGNIWRRIGSDYDVSKNLYKVTWHPANDSHLYSYKVRAISTDIRGNEKATGVLIDCGVKPLTDDEFLDLIESKAFIFFKDHQNLKTGLFSDTSGGGDASIASTGFGITALCVGAKRGWIDKKEAEKRVLIALNSFVPKGNDGKSVVEGKYGFFYHFVNIHTGERAGKSEISTVDTAILVAGAITAGEYFGGEVKEKATELYKNVEWGKFLSEEMGPWYGMFSMGWSPERGFLGSYWDYYTDEAVLICLLAIGSPTHPVDPGSFYAWTRHEGSYGEGKPFIFSWHGALFSYQYAQVWFDFRNVVDKKGVNWYENSRNATIANRQFCIDNKDSFKTFGPNTWGITSMDRPVAYTMHFGPPPTGNGEPQYDGTISPTGPSGSMAFTPYLSLSALKYMYITYPKLWGQYGLKDSFDLDNNWYSNTYYGIGVAMMVLPIENFRSGFVWGEFMKNEYIKEALKKAGFKRK